MPCWAFCLVSLQKIAISRTVMAARSQDVHLFLSSSNKQHESAILFPSSFFIFCLSFFCRPGILQGITSIDIFQIERLLFNFSHFFFLFVFFGAQSKQQTESHLAHLVKHTMGPIWDVDWDLRSAQLSESLGIQNKKESAFFLETETEEIM